MTRIKYKGAIYERVDNSTDTGMHDLREFYHNIVMKTYFGDIKGYLTEMANTDARYKKVLADFEHFVPAFQKLANSLKELPNFK